MSTGKKSKFGGALAAFDKPQGVPSLFSGTIKDTDKLGKRRFSSKKKYIKPDIRIGDGIVNKDSDLEGLSDVIQKVKKEDVRVPAGAIRKHKMVKQLSGRFTNSDLQAEAMEIHLKKTGAATRANRERDNGLPNLRSTRKGQKEKKKKSFDIFALIDDSIEKGPTEEAKEKVAAAKAAAEAADAPLPALKIQPKQISEKSDTTDEVPSTDRHEPKESASNIQVTDNDDNNKDNSEEKELQSAVEDKGTSEQENVSARQSEDLVIKMEKEQRPGPTSSRSAAILAKLETAVEADGPSGVPGMFASTVKSTGATPAWKARLKAQGKKLPEPKPEKPESYPSLKPIPQKEEALPKKQSEKVAAAETDKDVQGQGMPQTMTKDEADVLDEEEKSSKEDVPPPNTHQVEATEKNQAEEQLVPDKTRELGDGEDEWSVSVSSGEPTEAKKEETTTVDNAVDNAGDRNGVASDTKESPQADSQIRGGLELGKDCPEGDRFVGSPTAVTIEESNAKTETNTNEVGQKSKTNAVTGSAAAVPSPRVPMPTANLTLSGDSDTSDSESDSDSSSDAGPPFSTGLTPSTGNVPRRKYFDDSSDSSDSDSDSSAESRRRKKALKSQAEEPQPEPPSLSLSEPPELTILQVDPPNLTGASDGLTQSTYQERLKAEMRVTEKKTNHSGLQAKLEMSDLKKQLERNKDRMDIEFNRKMSAWRKINQLKDKKHQKVLEEEKNIVENLRNENRQLRATKEKFPKQIAEVKQSSKSLSSASEEMAEHFESLHAFTKKLQADHDKLEKSSAQSKDVYLPRYRHELRERQQFIEAETKVKNLYRNCVIKLAKAVEKSRKSVDLYEVVSLLVVETEAELNPKFNPKLLFASDSDSSSDSDSDSSSSDSSSDSSSSDSESDSESD